MLQRVRRTEGPNEGKIEAGLSVDHTLIKSVLKAVETDPAINRHETIYPYIEAYKEKGVDIMNWYDNHKKTSGSAGVKEVFLGNRTIDHAATLAESLPLFANTEGRLGDNIKARITKTAKQDDQGNTFIDLVIEVNNKWLSTDAPKELQDVPARMTFLVDVTVNDGESFAHKLHAQKEGYLKTGEKANVKCFKTEGGELGVSRPRLIISKQAGYMEKVGTALGDCITQTASDKYIINKPQKFDQEYQAYFLDLMESIAQNATENINYMKELSPDPKRQLLIKDYEKIVKFVDAYKKTPTKRTRIA